MKEIFTAGLFSGIGAINQAYKALEQEYDVTVKDLFGCDICNTAENSYRLNNRPLEYFSDIRDIKHSSKNYNMDILLSSAPCKPFSLALNEKYREGKLKSDEAFLTYETIDLLNSTKDKPAKLKSNYLIMENVPNLTTIENGNTWNEMLKAFSNLKEYHEPVWKIVDSGYFSATARKRVFLILAHKSVPKYVFPEIPEIRNSETINDHMQDVTTDLYDMKKPYTISNQIKMPNSGIKTYGKIDNAKFNQTAMIYNSSGKCPTITASHSPLIYDEKRKKPRHLTIQEIKSIMGYPKNFILNTNRSLAIEKIGNSIEIKTLVWLLRPILTNITMKN